MNRNSTWRSRRGSMLRRIAGPAVLAVAVMLAVAWWGEAMTGTALADEAVVEAAAQLTFEQPITNEDTVSLLVRLTADDGQPIARARVEFFVSPDFFGDRPVSLQTAITNADGLASLKYVPTWDGAHRMTALFAGNADYQPGETTIVMTVSGAVAVPAPAGETLHFLRLWAAPAVTLGAALVWFLIAGVLVRVGLGIWRERDLGEDANALPGTAIEKLPSGTDR